MMNQEPYRGIVLANRLLFPRNIQANILLFPEGGVIPPHSKKEEGVGETQLLPSKSNPWWGPCM